MSSPPASVDGPPVQDDSSQQTTPIVIVDGGTPARNTPQPPDETPGEENPSATADKHDQSPTTPLAMPPNGIAHQGFEDDDGSYTEYGDQNVMDEEDYGDDESSGGSMNEMLNNMRAEAIIDQLPAPPDGGYGWVIVAGAFFNNMIVDGISNSFGPFMAAYEKEFKESKALTSFIGALLIGCTLLFGPFAGGLLNRYNARVVVIGGAILAACAFFASTFSPNIFVAVSPFIYLPGIVVVSQYFESKRALATGIAVAGSGFGTFIVPVIAKYFIEEYSWRVTLYLSAIGILLCAASGGLFVPLGMEAVGDAAAQPSLKQRIQALLKKKFSRTRKPTEQSRAASVGSRSEVEGGHAPRPLSSRSRPNSQSAVEVQRDDGRPLLPNESDGQTTDGQGTADGDAETVASPSTPRRPHLSPINEGRVLNKSRTGSQHHHAERGPVMARTRKPTLTSMTSEFTTATGTGSRYNLSNQLSRISVRSYAQSLSRLSQINPTNIAESMGSVAVSSIDPKEFTRPFSRKDIFLQGSIKNLKEFEHEGSSFRNYRESQISIPKAVLAQSVIASRNTSQLDIADMSTRLGGSRYSRIGGLENEDMISLGGPTRCAWIPYPIRNSVQEMIDINLLKDPVMVLLCLTNIVAMLGFYVPLVFIIDLAVTRGSSVANGTVLLSIIGATNTFGRIFFGWLTDRRLFSALAISNVSLLVCGFLTIFCFALGSYPLLCVYASLFGFAISAFISLTSIVLSDLLGVERLTNSFGLLIVSRGLASLIGTPLAGCVYDLTRSYDATFVCAGTMFVLSGLIGLMVAVFHRREYNLQKDADAVSGKLSVLSERSEENLTEYQRTIQSVYAQQELIRELDEYKRQHEGKVSVVNEESSEAAAHEGAQAAEEPAHVVDLAALRAARSE
ncbi:Monocarboxylate transporter 5 [Aphelenchoides fujianensis]|nr:Monocarboxylate transporter 5 [Aphelenchoides fujianensis]